MAQVFKSDTYTPLKKETTVYSDFFSNFNIHPELHDLSLKTNAASITQALGNLIQTGKYERPFNPQFGCNLQNFLFEPISPVTQSNIENEIRTTIGNYEPRITLIDVIVTPVVERNAYNVSIKYSILNTGEKVTFSTLIIRTR